MNGQKVVGRRKAARTPTEFHAIGAQLDRELSVVKPFTRKRGFVFKARNWEELAAWELQRQLQEHRERGNE